MRTSTHVKANLREVCKLGYLVAVAKTTKKKDDLADYASKFASRGGKARAKALSPEKRRELARQAALARWNKVRK